MKWCNRCDLILGGICLDSESYALLSYWLADDDIGGEVNLVIVPGKRQLKPIMVATVE